MRKIIMLSALALCVPSVASAASNNPCRAGDTRCIERKLEEALRAQQQAERDAERELEDAARRVEQCQRHWQPHCARL